MEGKMEFSSIDEVVDFAIEKEQEAAEFYLELSEMDAAQSSKNDLIGFAQEEEKHAKMLNDFKADKSAFDNYEFKKIQDMKRADYMEHMDYTPAMSYHEVLRVAIKREEIAYKLYQDLGGSAKDDKLKNVFEILANEELKHKSKLEGLYDDIVKKTGD